MTITAKIIADSISEAGERITTLQLRYPRFIHAEFMTHRAFSRNASSSRAIPVERMIQDIIDDTAIPIHWGANQKGMQADAENDTQIYIEGVSDFDMMDNTFSPLSRQEAWCAARDLAVKCAKAFSKAGYHKQIVNRLLEPFMHINVLVTATQWSNFLVLRDHPAAQPEIRELAIQIKKAMEASTPNILSVGQWHLPYIEDRDYADAIQLCGGDIEEAYTDFLIPLSVARCASVSYMTVEGEPMTVERAKIIYDKLLGANPIHASPAEHQATPDHMEVSYEYDDGSKDFDYINKQSHGNFYGWIQYRKMLVGECQ
jgi:Thymidylate synthase complementing protein